MRPQVCTEPPSGEESSVSTTQVLAARSPLFSDGMVAAWLLAATAVLLQMLTNGRYGYFRDELYFMATGDHLAWGYVDFAPLAAWLMRASRILFGDGLHAIRLLPALAHGAEIVLTGFIVRELGGRRFAILLACLSVLVAPVILNNATRFSMNPFEPLFWMGCIYFVLLAINHPTSQKMAGGDPGLKINRPELLAWAGVMLGLGLMNKHSTVFFLISLVIGLLATKDRRLLRNEWFWIAAGIAFVIAVPNLIWQYQHHFPTLEDLENVRREHKNIELPPLPFIRQQIMMLGPASALVWIAGLGFLLFHREGKRYRSLGVTFLVFFTIMMVLHAKDYYLAPIYPMLFAAGGVFWEKLTETRCGLRWVKIAIPAAVLALGVIVIPLVVPVLPVQKLAPYMESLGMKISRTEGHHSGPLPQHFGDEFGWPEMVATVANVYNSMTSEERARTGILAGNYGEAGAIDFFGARYGLPKAISAHQNYYFWGPRQYTGESLILLQWSLEDAQYWCKSIEQGPTLDPYYGMGEEHYTILLCHGFKQPLAESWPHLKHWN
jgi:4-amino-4-deoxy-L-arabinose transferase-like glycosyltransferase